MVVIAVFSVLLGLVCVISTKTQIQSKFFFYKTIIR